MARFTFEEIGARLTAAGVGYTEVRRAAEVLEDAQAREQGKLLQVRYLGHDYEVPDFPVQGPASGGAPRADPPLLGEHTMEVLESLGYSAEECATLMAQQAIRGLTTTSNSAGG